MKLFFILSLILTSVCARANNVMFGPPHSATVTTTSTQLLPQNGLRVYLIMVNTGSVTVYVKFGSAQSGTEGVAIPAGGNYEPFEAPSNSVWAVTGSATSPLTLIEGQ